MVFSTSWSQIWASKHKKCKACIKNAGANVSNICIEIAIRSESHQIDVQKRQETNLANNRQLSWSFIEHTLQLISFRYYNMCTW